MADRWGLIAKDGNTWDGVVLDEAPTPDDDHYVVFVPADWPDACEWNPDGPGWKDKDLTPALITVGRFKLLLTKAERMEIRAAAASNADVEDFLDLLNGFTEGVSLSDPLLSTALNLMATDGLLTADRVTAILAGTPPA